MEAYASATALSIQAQAAAQENPESLLADLGTHRRGKIDGEMVVDAVRQGDPTATTVFAHYVDDLAEGIANIVNILQPEVVCIGGGVSGAGELLLVPLREKVQTKIYSRHSKKNTCIALARLGNTAGIIGAAGFYHV